jgi:hypothetical protein
MLANNKKKSPLVILCYAAIEALVWCCTGSVVRSLRT